ncbi:MAG TPA: peptide-methionine (R)-S-oxide reductase, partial [Candidatus Eisenbacteria bacterium]
MIERRSTLGLAVLALAGAALFLAAADRPHRVPRKPEAGRSAAGRAGAESVRVYSAGQRGYVVVERVRKTDEEWKKELTPEQYLVTRKKGTEPAFSGRYWNNHDKGVYRCVACGNDLFDSKTKFDSG